MKIRSRRRPSAATRHDEDMEVLSGSTPSGKAPGYRALVVDDEVPLADVVASYLRRDHFEVTVCHSGAEALARLACICSSRAALTVFRRSSAAT